MPIHPNVAPHIKLPSIKGQSSYARTETIAQKIAHGGGIGRGLTVPEETAAPFTDIALKRKFKGYDALAQGWMARALREPIVVARSSSNTGTGPELVLVGFYLSRGRVLDHTLFFQSMKFYGFRPTKAFVPDVAILGAFGRPVFMPVDGAFFHNSTEIEQLDNQARNAYLGRKGTVVAVPDWVCLTGAGLITFLTSKGLIT